MEDREKQIKEHQEYIKKRDKAIKERYLREFEELSEGEIFRKIRSEISTDYEFVQDNEEIEKYYYKNSDRNHINSVSLYFKKINNNLCEEILTGVLFKRTDDNIFYSDETGLKFDFYKSFEKAVGMKLDWVYVVNVQEYLNHYKRLQEEDIELRSNGQTLLLKKGINFTK